MMSLAKLKLQTTKNRQKRLRCSLALCGALGFSLALAAPAKAAFTGNYAPSQFTLMNTNADGTALSPDGGLSLVITGGNNGSGLPGMTDFVTAAAAAGLVRFQYSYSTLDMPMADFAGYLVGGVFSQLADTDGQSGTAMFPVSSGQSFGFRVGTADNTSEPGIFTISNFSAPTGPATVPEPGTGSLVLVVAGAAIALRCYKMRENLWGSLLSCGSIGNRPLLTQLTTRLTTRATEERRSATAGQAAILPHGRGLLNSGRPA